MQYFFQLSVGIFVKSIAVPVVDAESPAAAKAFARLPRYRLVFRSDLF